QAEDGIRDFHVTGVQTCALPISHRDGGSRALNVGDSSVRGLGESDVLAAAALALGLALFLFGEGGLLGVDDLNERERLGLNPSEIGRASCREGVSVAASGASWYM